MNSSLIFAQDSKTSSLGSYDIRIAELKREQEEYKASFKDNRGRELEIKKDIEENNEGIIKIEKKLTREKGNSQIYRLTKWLFKPSSVNPETGEIIESLAQEITPEDLRKTFLIWFGSLSFIVATIGTFLAFGGLVLQDLRPSEERGKIRKVLIGYLKILYEALLKRLRNPKIVKKVVEKVVEKKVEVPTEVYRDKIVYSEVPKEVVHTDVKYFPIYSDDPELLKHQVVKPKNPEKKPTNKK